MLRSILVLITLAFCAAGAAGSAAAAMQAVVAPGAGPVVRIPIHGVIDEGMAHLVQRSVDDARGRGARAILLDVDTTGGLVIAGMEIRDALLGAGVPVDAVVTTRAVSAGALVTLAAGRIVMTPGSSIGDAEPIPKTVKMVSALRTEFASTAARHHRDARLAEAMVDASLTYPSYKKPGQPLDLTADQAVAAGIAEAIVPNAAAAPQRFGFAGAPVVDAQYSFAERVARFATNPEVSGILLSIGFLGLLIEMQTLHGVAGIVGASALALFFGTHVYAGFSDSIVIGLAVLGLLGILLELHVLPGHGIAGSLGGLALISAILLAFGLPFIVAGLQALAIAIVLSVLCFAAFARIHPENAFVSRLVFRSAQGPEYVATQPRPELVGRRGVASSYLRPAGVVSIDGARVDVLTEGEFVPAGTPVRVTRVEGARIFVTPSDGEV